MAGKEEMAGKEGEKMLGSPSFIELDNGRSSLAIQVPENLALSCDLSKGSLLSFRVNNRCCLLFTNFGCE
ncbi:hypothetical protein LINPERPRIM_LOCUS21764 [Linum perenne]